MLPYDVKEHPYLVPTERGALMGPAGVSPSAVLLCQGFFENNPAAAHALGHEISHFRNQDAVRKLGFQQPLHSGSPENLAKSVEIRKVNHEWEFRADSDGKRFAYEREDAALRYTDVTGSPQQSRSPGQSE